MAVRLARQASKIPLRKKTFAQVASMQFSITELLECSKRGARRLMGYLTAKQANGRHTR